MEQRFCPRFASHSLEFVRLLGRGAFGEVSLIKASRLESDLAPAADLDGLVALKRVPVLQLSETGTEKALAEAKLLQTLASEHNCILHCFDFRLVAGSSPLLELLLEFAPLGDLSRRIRLQREKASEGIGLPEPEVICFGRDIAAGLSFLHSSRPKVFHRDIKPANVVLFPCSTSAARLRAKLADFGIAKLLESEATFAGAATIVGTPHYFAPELCRGQPYDERADSWALGCVLYEMLCLHRPFHRQEGNLAVLAVGISEGRYDREALSRRARHYNGLLIFTLTELLATEPNQRQRASAALESLDSCLSEMESAGKLYFPDDHALDTTADNTQGSIPRHAQADDTDSWRPMAVDGTRWPSNLGAQAPDQPGTQRPSVPATRRPSDPLTGLGDALPFLQSAAGARTPMMTEEEPVTQVFTQGPQDFAGSSFGTIKLPEATFGSSDVTLGGVPGGSLPGRSGCMSGAVGVEDPPTVQTELEFDELDTSPYTFGGGDSPRQDSLLETQYLDLNSARADEAQEGGPSRLAWAGGYTPEDFQDIEHHMPGIHEEREEREQVTEVPTLQADPGEHQPPEGTRLFMRPLRTEGHAPDVDPFDGPVIFCFQRPNSDTSHGAHVTPPETPAKPTAACPEHGASDTVGGATYGSSSTPQGAANGKAEWLQVVLPGTSGGLFSLTAVE